MGIPSTSARTPHTQLRVLGDGRRVTLRNAVPSDAPRLTLLGADFDGERGLVALDDHGAIVGHVGVASGLAVSDGWTESGLAALLAARHERRHGATYPARTAPHP
jgi:hypothetical protein